MRDSLFYGKIQVPIVEIRIVRERIIGANYPFEDVERKIIINSLRSDKAFATMVSKLGLEIPATVL